MMETATRTTIEIVAVECGGCGVVFGMSQTFYTKRREDHQIWYCPNGHKRVYAGKSELQKEAERLRGEVERERQMRQDAYTSLIAERDQRQAAERSNSALRGVVTKTKRRVGNGVCPCCNRHFVNVERHMANKHPEYAESGAET